jgi:hypothetical protein
MMFYILHAIDIVIKLKEDKVSQSIKQTNRCTHKKQYHNETALRNDSNST